MQYPEKCQLRTGFVYKELRNISVTICDAKNIMIIISTDLDPNNIIFGNVLTKTYQTYLPSCACAECPLRIQNCYWQPLTSDQT